MQSQKMWLGVSLFLVGVIVFLASHILMQRRDLSRQSYSNPIPCSPKDKLYKVFTVPKLGKFCLEKTRKDTIKSRLRRGQVWESEQKWVFKKYIRPNSVAVDIGAHIGSHTMSMAKSVGARGAVHAFEPQVKMYQELLVNLELNKLRNVYAHFAALGSSKGRVYMNPPTLKNEGGTSVGQGGNIVELRTLDSYKLNNVSFIKIDVEGAEEGVLLGAKETIKRNKPVLLVEILDYKKRAPQAKKTLKLIMSLGYKWFKRLRYGNYIAIPEGRKTK